MKLADYHNRREHVQAIVIFELIFSGLLLLAPILSFVMAILFTLFNTDRIMLEMMKPLVNASNPADEKFLEIVKAILPHGVLLCWISYIITGLLWALNYWGAYNLTHASQLGQDLTKASRMARCWLYISIFFAFLKMFVFVFCAQFPIPNLLLIASWLIQFLNGHLVYRFVILAEEIAPTLTFVLVRCENNGEHESENTSKEIQEKIV